MKNLENLKLFNIVLIGRPNVGKSSVFNFLVSKNEAVVKDEEGTTLDWRYKQIGNLMIWDSPGVFKLSNIPCKKIDIIYFVTDNNILNVDKEMYYILKQKYKILVIVNKADIDEDFDYSFFEDYIKISIKSRYNLYKLKNIMMENYENYEIEEKKTWAVLGKPNVGKSSLINKILKFDLHRVKDEEGTTKEFLPVDIDSNILLDTPGQRKKAIFPKYSNIFGIILVTDLQSERQDLRLISLAMNRNKPIFLVINKIDLAKNSKQIDEIINKFKKLFCIKIIKISCIKNFGIDNVLKVIKNMEYNFFKRIKTRELNDWLVNNIKAIEPRIKFVSQVETAYPKIYCDYKLSEDKERMFKKKLAQYFDFIGIPIKCVYEKNKN